MTRLLIFLPFLLLACGRPLTPQEVAFTTSVMGDQIDTSQVRVLNGALIGDVQHTYATRPQVACRERIWPAPKTKTVTVGTAAFVLYDTVFVARNVFAPDFMPDYPTRMSLPDAMLLAHEMTHVWQWQNRDRTGYDPLKAASEHAPGVDPYLLKLDSNQRFLDFPFEQQASIVEEYVCCRTLDPKGARTHRLRDMLKGEFPLDRVEPTMSHPKQIRLWKGAQISGICS